MSDLISREWLKTVVDNVPWDTEHDKNYAHHIAYELAPSAQPETCEGCKHLGKWENEVEYGYPSPCTRCKRRAEDRYER